MSEGDPIKSTMDELESSKSNDKQESRVDNLELDERAEKVAESETNIKDAGTQTACTYTGLQTIGTQTGAEDPVSLTVLKDPKSVPSDVLRLYIHGPVSPSVTKKSALWTLKKGLPAKNASVDSSGTEEGVQSSQSPQTSFDSSSKDSPKDSERTRTIPSGNSFSTGETFSASEERSLEGQASFSGLCKKTGDSKDSDLGTSPIACSSGYSNVKTADRDNGESSQSVIPTSGSSKSPGGMSSEISSASSVVPEVDSTSSGDLSEDVRAQNPMFNPRVPPGVEGEPVDGEAVEMVTFGQRAPPPRRNDPPKRPGGAPRPPRDPQNEARRTLWQRFVAAMLYVFARIQACFARIKRCCCCKPAIGLVLGLFSLSFNIMFVVLLLTRKQKNVSHSTDPFTNSTNPFTNGTDYFNNSTDPFTNSTVLYTNSTVPPS